MTEKGICPIQTVFGILGGKWKHRILLELHPGPMRYKQMGESIFVVFREMRRWGLECDPVHEPVCSHCWKCRGREETASGSADA